MRLPSASSLVSRPGAAAPAVWGWTRLAALLLPLLFAPPAAQALDPARAIASYSHQAWLTDDGLPSNSIQAVAQTRDGYLWLGTKAGIVRFDGVRFTTFDKQNTKEIVSNDILGLYEDRQGNLWISTEGGGLVRLRDGRFTLFTKHEGLGDDSISAVYQDRTGRVWVSTRRGLSLLQGDRFITYTRENNLPLNRASGLCEDRQGRLWVGTFDGLHLFQDGKLIPYALPGGIKLEDAGAIVEGPDGALWIASNGGGLYRLLDGRVTRYTTKEGLTSNAVRSLHFDRDGNLWIGTTGGGLNRLHDNRFSAFTTKEGLSHDFVGALHEDREGSLWIGTYGGGLNRLKNGKFITYGTKEGLSHDFAFTVYQDRREGALWVGTYGGGVSRLKDGKFTYFKRRNGLSDDIVRAIAETDDGAIWIGTYTGGLNRLLPDGRITHYQMRDGLSSNAVYALYADRAGALWIGTDRGLNVLRDGKFHAYTTADGLPHDMVRSIYEDAAGNLWVGTYGGGLGRLRDGRFTAYTTRDGLSDNFVRSVFEDDEGALWLATYGGGINRFKDNRFTAYTTKTGLYDNTIYEILEDGLGNFWMSCNRGIFYVSRKDLNDYADGRAQSITCTAFGTADGMRSSECNGGNQPAGWRSRDGQLWFPTIRGVVLIDPRRVRTNTLPPPVLIEGQFADDQLLAAQDGELVLPPGKDRLEFHYTALSLLAPEKVQFKYQLEGYDHDWINAGTRRVAYYTNLPPGRYTFRVIACNNDGVWNETGAAFTLTLAPHFYQTKTFYLLCALAAGALLAALIGLRVRRMKRRERELLSLVRERTSQLEAANETLNRLTTIDGLTGIANRRRFDEFLDGEWRRAYRDRAPLSLFLIDIDYFKNFNDAAGHQGGDSTLRRVAGALNAFRRPGDLVARYGGEEFVVVLSGIDAPRAAELAEALRARVEALQIPHPASPVGHYVTISVGVVTGQPSDQVSPSDLIAAADRALYQAKSGGRNQVRLEEEMMCAK